GRECFCVFFFFQAEDGIRDWSVTGVQTCALPIWLDVAAVIELLGEAEIALSDSGAAVERGRALITLGTASHCDLIIAHGERLLGHALAASDVPAACAHLETALAAFVHAGIPYRTAQTRLMLAPV